MCMPTRESRGSPERHYSRQTTNIFRRIITVAEGTPENDVDVVIDLVVAVVVPCFSCFLWLLLMFQSFSLVPFLFLPFDMFCS